MALSKISLFKSPIGIKPDLSQEERNIENFLLKEQCSLTQSGIEDKKRIKIRNKSILIDNEFMVNLKTLNSPNLNIIHHLKPRKRANQTKSNLI